MIDANIQKTINILEGGITTLRDILFKECKMTTAEFQAALKKRGGTETFYNTKLGDVEAALRTVLDAVDYTAGYCSPTDMVGAVLDKRIISLAKSTLKRP